MQATFLPFRHLPSRGRVALGRSVGRGQGCADVVAGTFFDAPCPKVGAGFQPAQAIPQVENLRPLQATCGHFGRSKNAAEGFDYAGVRHLRAEAAERHARIRPRTLGQAGRVSGITPADLALVLVYLEGRGA